MTLKTKSIFQPSADFTPEESKELMNASSSKNEKNTSTNHNHPHEFQIHNKRKNYEDPSLLLEIEGIGNNSWQMEGELFDEDEDTEHSSSSFSSSGGGGISKAVLKENPNGDILAVIQSEKCGMHMNYKLLSPTPKYFGQKPSSHHHETNNSPRRIPSLLGRKKKDSKDAATKLYEHAIVSKKNYFLDEYNIQDITENDGRVDYVAKAPSTAAPSADLLEDRDGDGPSYFQELKVYDAESHRCCGTVSPTEESKEDNGQEEMSWKVSANDAINPKIMVCLTAIASH